MIKCPYCGRWFKNKQALRAHLKYCPAKKDKATKLLKVLEVVSSKKITKIRDIALNSKMSAEEIISTLKWGEKTFPSHLKVVYKYVKHV